MFTNYNDLYIEGDEFMKNWKFIINLSHKIVEEKDGVVKTACGRKFLALDKKKFDATYICDDCLKDYQPYKHM